MSGAKVTDLLASGSVDVELVEGLAGAEVKRRLGLAVRIGEACHRAVAFYLEEVEARGLVQGWGYASAWQYAQQGLGLTKARASELLMVGRRLRELAVLDRAFADGELCWSKVRLIARVATPETEAAWVAKAKDARIQEVEGLVSVSKPGDGPGEVGKGLPQARFKVRLVQNRVQHEMWEAAREKLGQELGRAVSETELADELVRLFLGSDADGSVPGPKKVDGSLFRVAVEGDEAGDVAVEAAASDAAVTPRTRRRVLARDGMRCQSCEGQRSLMVHHVVWRSRGGTTAMQNLVTLCPRCHGLVHEELLFVSGQPGGWRFRGRDGRALHDTAGKQAGVRVRAEFAMRTVDPRRTADDAGAAEPAAEVDPRPQSLTLDDIPDVVDAAWWRAHEHLLEWSKDGKSVRIRSQPSRARRRRVG